MEAGDTLLKTTRSPPPPLFKQICHVALSVLVLKMSDIFSKYQQNSLTFSEILLNLSILFLQFLTILFTIIICLIQMNVSNQNYVFYSAGVGVGHWRGLWQGDPFRGGHWNLHVTCNINKIYTNWRGVSPLCMQCVPLFCRGSSILYWVSTVSDAINGYRFILQIMAIYKKV